MGFAARVCFDCGCLPSIASAIPLIAFDCFDCHPSSVTELLLPYVMLSSCDHDCMLSSYAAPWAAYAMHTHLFTNSDPRTLHLYPRQCVNTVHGRRRGRSASEISACVIVAIRAQCLQVWRAKRSIAPVLCGMISPIGMVPLAGMMTSLLYAAE